MVRGVEEVDQLDVCEVQQQRADGEEGHAVVGHGAGGAEDPAQDEGQEQVQQARRQDQPARKV